jgi:poly(A) polymerase
MIKKFIHKLLGRSMPGAAAKPAAGATALGKRVEVPKSEHGIDP